MKLSALSCYLGYVDYPVVVIYAKSVTSSMSLGIPLTCVKGRVVTIIDTHINELFAGG
jgi:hypothetical protein|uniref:Uncharacterized protein n=1 Tax=Picea glauca TaxID=3330 RepID=A0A101M231_PICGL|nr:hypothetical protein ABT39_MTgene4006 [Picea glauca]